MIIDLSSPRTVTEKFLKNLIINIKIKNYNFNKEDIALTGIIMYSLISNNNALACDAIVKGLNSDLSILEKYVYPVIFALCEASKGINYKQLSAVKNYILKTR